MFTIQAFLKNRKSSISDDYNLKMFLVLNKGGERSKPYRERSFSFRTEAVSSEGRQKGRSEVGWGICSVLKIPLSLKWRENHGKCGKMTSPCKIWELGTWVSLGLFLCFSDWLKHCMINILVVNPKVLYQKSLKQVCCLTQPFPFWKRILKVERWVCPDGGHVAMRIPWQAQLTFKECSSLCDWGTLFLFLYFLGFLLQTHAASCNEKIS